jgi:alkaline phosphatase D
MNTFDTSTPFRHGVASGDPLPDSVIIWTRVSTRLHQPIEVTWTMACDSEFSEVVATGTVETSVDADYTVKADVRGLEPDHTYFYRFAAQDRISPTGRTRALPGGEANHLRFAQVSCAKFNAGFFNAYARIAERNDLHFLLHLGDYIYEASNTPPPSQTPGADIGRPFDPLHECKTLDDYRRRYAQYHLDPDVQCVHASLPLIAVLDDHELADGAWRGGASEHKEERDGPWVKRHHDALRARWEWLPLRMPDASDPLRVWQQLSIGSLADMLLIDTRSHRDKPVGGVAMHNPDRTALGLEQRTWLLNALSASTAKWRLVVNPSVMATTWREGLPDKIIPCLIKVKLIESGGNGPDYDQWDGYPSERAVLLSHVREQQIGTVVLLSGDVHVGLATELKVNAYSEDETPVAVEFVNPSLTSQNLDDKMCWEPRGESKTLEQTFLEVVPHIRWCDLDSHGYNIVDVTSQRIVTQYWIVDTVLSPSDKSWRNASWMVNAGEPRLHPAEDREF